MTRSEIARQLIGVRFRHQGRSLNGLDCAGVIWWVEKQLGREPVDVPAYRTTPWKDGLREAVEAHYGPPVAREPQVNDVLLMTHSCKEPQHLAIVGLHPLGCLSIIHAYAGNSARKVVETILDEPWRKKIVAVYA